MAKVLARRGNHAGLVHVLWVMETCTTSEAWHDKSTGRTGLKMVPGQCGTYYFYLIDPQLGLMSVRVPTWLPCRLQIYINFPHWLAAKLQAERIDFEMEDNAFVKISDWKRAQELAASFSVQEWKRKFHALAARFAPVVEKFSRGYHWSVMQVEHSLDLVFKKRTVLAPLLRGDQPTGRVGSSGAGHGQVLGQALLAGGRGAERLQDAGGGHPHQTCPRQAIHQDG